jgi:hypothetical protein
MGMLIHASQSLAPPRSEWYGCRRIAGRGVRYGLTCWKGLLAGSFGCRQHHPILSATTAGPSGWSLVTSRSPLRVYSASPVRLGSISRILLGGGLVGWLAWFAESPFEYVRIHTAPRPPLPQDGKTPAPRESFQSALSCALKLAWPFCKVQPIKQTQTMLSCCVSCVRWCAVTGTRFGGNRWYASATCTSVGVCLSLANCLVNVGPQLRLSVVRPSRESRG